MPRGDGTGPSGMGPMTGRAAGYCAGYEAPGYATPGFGGGRGYGMGGGRGRRNMYYATGLPGWARAGGYAAPMAPIAPVGPYAQPDPEFQKQTLKSQADALQAQLDLVMKRIADLETSGAEK